MAIRVTQVADEVLGAPTPNLRVTQAAIELQGIEVIPKLRVTQAAIELQGIEVIPKLRVTQVAIEILSPTAYIGQRWPTGLQFTYDTTTEQTFPNSQ